MITVIPEEKKLTKKNILDKIDSLQLFKTYCKNFKEIGKMFKSEFRDEKNPSCSIIVWHGDLLYKDFGDRSFRVFDYIAYKYNTDFNGALEIVNRDFGLGLGNKEYTPIYRPRKTYIDLSKLEHKSSVINIQPRDWEKKDERYWGQYGIPLRLLSYHNIKPISAFYKSNNKGEGWYRINKYDLAYSFDYYWHKGIFRRKLYFPMRKNNRFLSNIDNTVVQGWVLLPKKGNILFVTKGYKDICIFNMLGYWAIAPNSEKTYIPDKVMQKLKNRFKEIYTWFDNDETGINGAISFGKKFGIPSCYNPLGEPKDPSDYVKEYSLSRFEILLNEKIGECRKQAEEGIYVQ